MNDFLPDTYEVPTKSNYTRLNKGETVLRILEKPILGYELWIKGKPKRYRMDQNIPMSDLNDADIDKQTGLPRNPRHFWAMVVWNYDQKTLQIWEVTQKSIMTDIKALSKSKLSGSPLGYDISIVKSGDGFDTKYKVINGAKAEVSPEILKQYQEAKIDVSALYEGKDPFANVMETEEQKDEFVPETEVTESEDISDQIPF